MAMGSLSDGFVAQSYDAETTKGVMESYISITETSLQQLEKLFRDGNLSQEDKKILSEIMSTYRSLVKQGKSLVAYIDTGNVDNLKEFEEHRKTVTGKIESLLH